MMRPVGARRLDIAEFVRVFRALQIEPVETFQALGWL